MMACVLGAELAEEHNAVWESLQDRRDHLLMQVRRQHGRRTVLTHTHTHTHTLYTYVHEVPYLSVIALHRSLDNLMPYIHLHDEIVRVRVCVVLLIILCVVLRYPAVQHFLYPVVIPPPVAVCFHRDCRLDPECVLCKDCFQNSTHRGHDYKVCFQRMMPRSSALL